MTDKQRLDWLCSRVSYLEHEDKLGTSCQKIKVGSYWPQEESDACPEGDMVGLELIDYIDAQIAKEA